MRSKFTTAAIAIALVAAFCFVSNDDFHAQQDDQVYVAEIMENAKNDALADKREALIQWGEQFVPVSAMNNQ